MCRCSRYLEGAMIHRWRPVFDYMTIDVCRVPFYHVTLLGDMLLLVNNRTQLFLLTLDSWVKFWSDRYTAVSHNDELMIVCWFYLVGDVSNLQLSVFYQQPILINFPFYGTHAVSCCGLVCISPIHFIHIFFCKLLLHLTNRLSHYDPNLEWHKILLIRSSWFASTMIGIYDLSLSSTPAFCSCRFSEPFWISTARPKARSSNFDARTSESSIGA